MKYPYIIFYRYEKYNLVDRFFIENGNALECSIFIANNIENVKNLHNSNFHLLVTYGNSVDEYKNELLTVLSKEMLIRHVHMNNNVSLSNVKEFNEVINMLYVNLCARNRSLTRPTFSLFTTSYNSYDKILRVYNSLKNQILKDWEWVIIDDSPDDKHFDFLRRNFDNDSRIRLYRRSKNNGSIGNVKNEAIGLCRGKYVLEMDHDDEILPYVLQDSADVFNNNPNVGFIYMDCACVYENGKNQWYGDFICKGYGGYYSQKYNDKWLLVYVTPNINNITMSHLVCCPNHPRIWRRDTLMQMGSYCEYLPICDDYEILLKTSITTQMAKIHKLGYIQYMNESNNNFSLIRNAEINRIGPNYISPMYYKFMSINEKMKMVDAYEDEKYIVEHSKIWERDKNSYEHKYCNLIVNNDFDCQYCIIGLDSLLFNLERIKLLYENSRNDFLVLENKCTLEYLQQRLEHYGFDRMKCYTLVDTNNDVLITYFKMMYKSTEKYEIINIDICKPIFNTTHNMRSKVINQLTNTNDKYLEIGVEYGETFNSTHFTYKVGVDPDPKCSPIAGKIFKCTSDVYFEDTNKKLNEQFDVIFIDGMHQVEYVLKDINNSINILTKNGFIFIDDILPFNYNEQLKIPVKHYYENGILKYGENWTGDVWKVIYYILLNFSDKLSTFKYYYNINFRGIAAIQLLDPFQVSLDSVDEINNYNYYDDYKKYVELLGHVCK